MRSTGSQGTQRDEQTTTARDGRGGDGRGHDARRSARPRRWPRQDGGRQDDGPAGQSPSTLLRHPLRQERPCIQIITQHYCGTVGTGMHQCLLYDSVGKNARLLGVEYIVSDEIFQKLPDVEKRYWHPHTYGVLGGGLIAPAMKPEDEMAFMKGLLLTWGARRGTLDRGPRQGVRRQDCRYSQEADRGHRLRRAGGPAAEGRGRNRAAVDRQRRGQADEEVKARGCFFDG